ncbi:succinate dehydrogenase assembly factor 2 [Rhodovibrionaceae bacterium A322]
MSDELTLDQRRKRLVWQSWHRGMREMDLLLGNFAEAHLEGFSADQLDLYEVLLRQSDPDLYNWMTNKLPPPEDLNHEVMALMQAFEFTPAR